MALRKTPAPTGRARVARQRIAVAPVEGLETRQLLSVAPLAGHAHRPHPRHHRHAATHDSVITSMAGTARPDAAASPVGLTPATVRHAYGIDATSFDGVAGNGSGQTIAVVDAYDDPSIRADLASFDAAFGLADTTLTVEGQTGSTTALPGLDPAGKGNSWALETSLDVEWAHAVAPAAKILLLEANSSSLNDLFAAVDTARNTAGVSVVSMSFGSPEFSGDGSYDYHFTTPAGHQGVTFVASGGDSGAYTASGVTGIQYPAASPNVLAVGGTRLTVDSSGNYASETAWGSGSTSYSGGGAGGGVSQYTSQPAYQQGTVTQSTTRRSVPDVAFLADPASGVAVIDSYDFGSTPWLAVGGTSLAAPMWAGVVATVNQGRALSGLGTLDGHTGTLPAVYGLPSTDFHDVTSGSNGYSAGPGYDLVTGRGTPVVNLLAPALAGNGSATTPTPTPTPTPASAPTIGALAANPSAVAAGTNVTFTASNVAETGGTVASVKFYEETNGTAGLQPATDTLVGSGTQTATGTWAITASTAGMAAGTYTVYAVAADAGGASSAAKAATLTVTGPSNDSFAKATALAGSSATATGSNVNATREAGEPYIAGNRGGRSVWYTWTAPASGTVHVNTTGSSFDTLLGVYTGSGVSSLSLVASNDDQSSTVRTSAVTFSAVAGRTYRIAVDGYNGTSGAVKLAVG